VERRGFRTSSHRIKVLRESLILDDGSVEEAGGEVVGILDGDAVLELDAEGRGDLAEVSTVVSVDLGHGGDGSGIRSSTSLGLDLLHSALLGLEVGSRRSGRHFLDCN